MNNWRKTPADRARDAKVYGPEYRKNRALALKRAGGRCEQLLENGRRCGSRDRVQVDHVIPVTRNGTHHLENLRCLCAPHHRAKTATEGGGYRRSGGRGRGEIDPPASPRTRW
jgi:5-methylcytosine-specific restriction protein A